MIAEKSLESSEEIPCVVSQWTISLLSRVVDKMRESFEQRVSHLGLRSKHYSILLLLRGGPQTQTEIGRRARVDRSTMVALIDDLERLGLVERARHAEDRRAHAVTLTNKGREVEREAALAVDATEAECFEPLQPDEREQLRALLSKLL